MCECESPKEPKIGSSGYVKGVIIAATAIVLGLGVAFVMPTPEERTATERKRVLNERWFWYQSEFSECLEKAPRNVRDGASVVESCRAYAREASIMPGTEHIQ